jgi:hypothetical protein
MDQFLVTTHELMRVERVSDSDIRAYGPVKVQFSFHLGFDVCFAVTAEVTEMREGYQTTGHDVTILECVEENGNGELKPYAKGCEVLRAEIEKQAVEFSHNKKHHIKN